RSSISRSLAGSGSAATTSKLTSIVAKRALASAIWARTHATSCTGAPSFTTRWRWTPKQRAASAAQRGVSRASGARSGPAGALARRPAVNAASSIAGPSHRHVAQPQDLEDRARRRRLVQGVEVDPRDRRARGREGAVDRRGEQGAALVGGVRDAGPEHLLRVALGAAQALAQALGDAGAAQLGEALDLLVVGDGHDAGEDRDGDAGRGGAGDEVVVGAVVEEELGDEEVDAGVDLVLEPAEV